MKVLVINSYAGSLTLGAHALDADIVGSYEDSGFGIAIQKENFPGLHFVDNIKSWPSQDLRDTVVIAHPPCAAFSQQNTSASKRGVDTDAFACTVRVLDYATKAGAKAIAIESVMGALAGAYEVHDRYAQDYHLYRVTQNGILFGVPQWRERFWAVFVRKDLADPLMIWTLTPYITNIGITLDPLLPGTPLDALERTTEKLTVKLAGHGLGITRDHVDAVFATDLSKEVKRHGFARLIQPQFWPNENPKVVLRKYVSAFTSAQPSVLAPWGFAPVLLGSSFWVYRGAPVPEEGYKAIMGFPVDYYFPDDHRERREMRKYLSKGVCPPVASWILSNIAMHIRESVNRHRLTTDDGITTIQQTCEPGHVVAFRPRKPMIMDYLTALRDGTTPPAITVAAQDND